MLKWSSFLFLCLLWPSTTFAQTYTRYRLPVGSRLTVNSVTYQGYTLPEFQELLNMDNDLRLTETTAAAQATQISLLEEAQTHLQVALTACTNIHTTLDAERVRLSQALDVALQENVQLRSSNEWDLVPWVVAGVLLVTTVVFGALLAL